MTLRAFLIWLRAVHGCGGDPMDEPKNEPPLRCEGKPTDFLSGCDRTAGVRWDADYGRHLCPRCWQTMPIPPAGRNKKP